MAEITEPQFVLRYGGVFDGLKFGDATRAKDWLLAHGADDRRIEILTTDTVKVFGRQEEVKVSKVMGAREFVEHYTK
jgi:hypothetical protein